MMISHRAVHVGYRTIPHRTIPYCGPFASMLHMLSCPQGMACRHRSPAAPAMSLQIPPWSPVRCPCSFATSASTGVPVSCLCTQVLPGQRGVQGIGCRYLFLDAPIPAFSNFSQTKDCPLGIAELGHRDVRSTVKRMCGGRGMKVDPQRNGCQNPPPMEKRTQ